MTQLWVNNYTTTLVEPLSAVDTEMTVNSAPDGAIGPGEFVLLTVEDANNPARLEIVKVTAIVGDVLTIERAQEGSTAQAFAVNDIAQGRMTAGTLADLYQKSGQVMAGEMDMGGFKIVNLNVDPNPTPDQAASVDYARKKEPQVSGLLTGGLLTANGTTQIDVQAGSGLIIDSYTDTDDPVTTPVSWPASTETVPNLVVDGRTYVFVDNTGTVVFHEGEITPQSTRTLILLGLAYRSNGIVVSVYSEPTVSAQNGALLYDFINFVADVARVNGGFVKAQVAGNLKLTRDAAKVFVPGASWHDNRESPNTREYVTQDPAQFRFIDRFGTLTDGLGALVSDVDPTRWDNAGVVETVPNPGNTTTIQYIFMAPSGNHLIQWGQKVYDSIGEAVDASGQDLAEYIPAPGSADMFLLAQLIVEKSAGDLTDAGEAQIFNTRVGYSGGSSSGLYVLRSGDSMTGELILPGAPTGALAATDKTYVDAADTALANDISDNTDAILINKDNIAANTSNIFTNTGNISTNTGNISTNSSDIVTNAGNISTNAGDITALQTGKLSLTGGTLTGDVGSEALIQADLGFVAGHSVWPNDANMGCYNDTGGTGLSQSAAGYSGIYQYSAAGGYEKPFFVFSRDGQTTMYYNGQVALSSQPQGVNVGHSSITVDQGLAVLTSLGGVQLYANGPTGNLGVLQTSNAGARQKTWIEGVRDGQVSFFFNDVKMAETNSLGLEVNGKIQCTAAGSGNHAALFVQPSTTPTEDIIRVTWQGVRSGGWDTASRVMSWGPLLDLSASDERSKENIEDIPYGLDTILALRPTRHDYKDEFLGRTNKQRLGFIAQEVMEVCPALHYTVDDEKMPGGVRHGVQEASLIPILVKAVQELTARVVALGG